MTEDTIRLFVTGGTFDKEYDELKGELTFRETHVKEMLELGRSKLDIKVRTLMMVDSLDMTEDERDSIVKQCIGANEDKIVITHGTDTMVKTASRIAGKNLDKTIVLTGAMVPYTFGSTDGLFNLGSALAFVQILEPGVYIAMNGRYFLWNMVEKNKKIGIFESKV